MILINDNIGALPSVRARADLEVLLEALGDVIVDERIERPEECLGHPSVEPRGAEEGPRGAPRCGGAAPAADASSPMRGRAGPTLLAMQQRVVAHSRVPLLTELNELSTRIFVTLCDLRKQRKETGY